MLSRSLVAFVLTLAATAMIVQPAWADLAPHGGGAACGTDSWGGECRVHAEDPQTSKPAQPGSGRTDPTRNDTCLYKGREVDCKSDLGTWSNERECWVKRADVQPPKTDPVWEGHDDGAIYWCTPPHAALPLGDAYRFWGPSGTPLVDPIDLAEQAIQRMRLKVPRLGTTPLNPEAPTVVGVPTWLWLADQDPQSYGPITRTATAGATTVTATAHVTSVTWDLGDGTTIICASPGTPWTPAHGTGPSPNCGHTYQRPSLDQPDRTYDLTATTHWQVDWHGAGQTGQITFALTGSRELEVTEIQVLQTR